MSAWTAPSYAEGWTVPGYVEERLVGQGKWVCLYAPLGPVKVCVEGKHGVDRVSPLGATWRQAPNVGADLRSQTDRSYPGECLRASEIRPGGAKIGS